MSRKSVYYSKKTKMEKILTSVMISKPIFEKVTKLAPEVYGVSRGALSYAVEEGLKWWLMHHTGALKGVHQNPRPTVREAYNSVLREISHDNNFLIPNLIRTGDLLICTMRALGIKERSAKSWIHNFYAQGLIKPYLPNGVKIGKSSEVARVKIWELVAKEA